LLQRLAHVVSAESCSEAVRPTRTAVFHVNSGAYLLTYS
jgi:hypothetical protein